MNFCLLLFSFFVYKERFSFLLLPPIDMFLGKKQQSFYNKSLNFNIPIIMSFLHVNRLIKVVFTSR
ncbi:hypothetical protein BTA37_29250 [Priestia megaterium]|nr:hypothetical protein BTA37_29250 [Priestia megaterium]